MHDGLDGIRCHRGIFNENIKRESVGLIQNIRIGLTGIFGQDRLRLLFVDENLPDPFHRRFDHTDDDFAVLDGKGFSRDQTLNEKFNPGLPEVFGADELTVAIFHQAKGKRGGGDDAIDQALRKAGYRLGRRAGLNDVDTLHVVKLHDGLQRVVGNRSQPANADFFPRQICRCFNIGFYDQRLNRIGDGRRDLDDIASLQHIRN